MQSGRILPTFRQFFNASAKAGNTNRDSNSQQGQQQAERDATEEEARRAADLLQNSDEFKKNGISVKAGVENNRYVLVVSDRNGNALRVIQSPEVVRILLSFGMPQASRQGRILDRRI
jgi:hypothetical protein